MMVMDIPIFIVDAFSVEPFKGNQAAVCLLEGFPQTYDDKILQQIAFEMNLSETAFIKPLDSTKSLAQTNEFNLRWFTIATEVDLCGHATLASAHVLFNELGNRQQEILFHTLSGILKVSKDDNSIVMDFPVNEPEKTEANTELGNYLGLTSDEMIEWAYEPTLANLLIEVKNEQILRDMKPDIGKLKKFSGSKKIDGIIVTSKMSNINFDFSSRYFAPWVGIDEDPVTGSSHTTLGPYWASKLHKQSFKALQLSKRTGELEVTLSKNRVFIKGKACTTLKGSFKLS